MKIIKNICIFLFFCGCSCGLCGADSQQKIFDRTVKYLDRGGLYFHYQNTEGLAEQFSALLDVFGKTYINDPVQNMVLKNVLTFLNALKLDELQAFGSSNKQVGKNLYANKLFAAVKQTSDGMLCALPGRKNVSFSSFAALPENTVIGMGAYWDWSNFYSVMHKNYAKDENFKSVVMMLEMNTGVKMPDLMRNISGQYFAGIFSSAKEEEFHYLLIIPDKNGVLRKIASTYAGGMLRKDKNGFDFIQMPTAASSFGNGVTVRFAKGQIMIYNSNANADELLNLNGKKKKLTAVNPQLFGNMKNPVANSFMVMNFNTSMIDSDAAKNIYQYSSLCTVNADGYLVSSMSNFNLQDLSEYTPLLEVLPDIKQFIDQDDDKNAAAPAVKNK